MTLARKIIDNWSPLSHRTALASTRAGSSLAPTWVGEAHERRLAAYKILAAYYRNVQRDYIENDDPKIAAALSGYREFGDPKTFRDAIVSALLGYDPPQIVVDGADDDPPDDSPDTAARREAAQAKQDRQAWFRAWDRTEHAGTELFKGERKSVGLGDGVWVFRVSTDQARVTMRTYDPGFYFPVLSEDDRDRFPRKIHLAWEFTRRDDRGREREYVRRQTWELIRLAQPVNYPWNTDENGNPVSSDWTCVHSDGTWPVADIARRTIEDFNDEHAVWATNETGQQIRNLDLGIDFLPVVHIPNLPPEDDHYGESALANVAQLQDDIAQTDTDIAKAAALTAVPMLGASGVNVGDITVRPGTVVNLGTDGKLSVVDLSAGLAALMGLQTNLLERRDANGRIPAALLGRVDPAKVNAGIILSLSFGPLRALIGEMRLSRDEKYPLMCKIVQRMSIAAGFLDGPVYDATWSTTSFLPTDAAALVEQVAKLHAATLVSRPTAIGWLQSEGFDYDDPAEELDRIRREDFTGAEQLLTATGDESAVFEYLGRDLPVEPPAPTGPPGDQPEVT